ncbi:hypothetical protein, partial [Nocardioides pelophilus]|uniref:hypothetical protein n=1 Tax=Nocardioides pelophilus TaxID=2172019 RepID=UPI001C7FA35E
MQSLRAARAPRVRRTLLALAACAATALATTPAGAEAPAATASAAPLAAAAQPDDSDWQVVDLGNGRFQVSWTARQDLPTGSDRPTITGDGLSFGPSTVTADGRTVTAV